MTEHLSAIFLILALLGVSLYFAWRQFKTFSWLKTQPQMMPEDRHYYRRQAIRRLIGCGLTLVLAGLFIGMFTLGVMDGLSQLNALGDQVPQGTKLTEEQEQFVIFSLNYFLVFMLVLFIWLLVAFLDLMAIRRFGMRHRKRIRDDRRAMLMRQLPLLRREREENG